MNYVTVFDEVIPPDKCDYFIDKFENDTDAQEIQDNSHGATLTQINMLHSPETIWKEDVNFLMQTMSGVVEEYRLKHDISSYQWPEKFGLEPPKMKRYLPGTSDEFPPHVDVLDYETARRFLVVFFYLSDNIGGHTYFPNLKLEVECKKGSCLMFPPMWTHAHAGKPPVITPKYIIGSYLQYV
jgi:prolyl 4-hydroxylase|tara:strand:- start:359 stop:907 length:549 start_codon:yes stop_codon:yes gene_type:complete